MSQEPGLEEIDLPGEENWPGGSETSNLYLVARDSISSLPEFVGKPVLEEVFSTFSPSRVLRGLELVEHRLSALQLQRIAGQAEPLLEERLSSTHKILVELRQYSDMD